MIFRPVDVLGQPVDPDMTLLLHHEHLCCDATCWHQPSDDPQTQRAVADADLEDVRRRPWSYEDNLRLGDELVADEIGLIPSRRPAIIDVTPVDIGRSPEGLRALAVKTGVQVFMGCGRYVEGARAGETAKERGVLSRRDPARSRGPASTACAPGVIGEVGVSNPITPLEEGSLRGAAQAQSKTGAPLLVHVDGWDPNAHEALDIVESEGADLADARLPPGLVRRPCGASTTRSASSSAGSTSRSTPGGTSWSTGATSSRPTSSASTRCWSWPNAVTASASCIPTTSARRRR